MKNMIIKQYIVDAFTDTIFKGNPAAVCVLNEWLPEEIMMGITLENNFSETAFTVKEKDGYHLRWFTPGGEIDLCGHATLATAYVLLHFYEQNTKKIIFHTKSGLLEVIYRNDMYEMDFPSFSLSPVKVTDQMEDAIGIRPIEAWLGRDLVCVVDNEDQITNLNPDQSKVSKLEGLLLHVTAQGKKYDCISRTFAPKMGVVEDAVCGSGHCHIVPLWADKLNKDILVARQASNRGGTLYCQRVDNRIKVAGNAVLYSESTLFLDSFIYKSKE